MNKIQMRIFPKYYVFNINLLSVQQGREILMRMLEVFVLKFHTITKYQLPAISAKCKPQSEANGSSENSTNTAAATTTVSNATCIKNLDLT